MSIPVVFKGKEIGQVTTGIDPESGQFLIGIVPDGTSRPYKIYGYDVISKLKKR